MLDFRIGMFMGLRQIQRASVWTTLLIVTVILFTFLNLILVSGILIGIVDGAKGQSRDNAYGDITFKPLPTEDRILDADSIFQKLDTYPYIQSFSPRYTGLTTIEANYKERRDLSAERDLIAVTLTGIDPVREHQTLDLGSLLVEGEYFKPGESGYILIGKHYIDRYEKEFGDVYPSLANVYPGSTVRVTVGSKTEEFKVKGIIDSKVDQVSLSVFIPEKEFRRLYDRADTNPNQIIVRLNPGYSDVATRKLFEQIGLSAYAEITTFSEGTPKFVADVEKTFGTLGIFVGIIGIGVASITVFIVIFINALSRKRQIGILKAIGISERAIEYAYITQAGIYSFVGSLLGVLITVFILVPYFEMHPIDFPYSFVSLSIDAEGILYRCLALFSVTLVAGFIPAWLIVRQNTINSILGRR